MLLLDKILIANRGEIALRIIRSAKKLAIRTVAVCTSSEQDASYLKQADEVVCLDGDDLASTYLNIDQIIKIAIVTGSKAIHPGYGFLSENPDFAKACEEHQITFIGPGSEVLRLMGNKPAAKSLAESLGIPVALSLKLNPNTDFNEDHLQFPVLIKASYGGGGKGMELVHTPHELRKQVEKSSRIAANYFGNGEIFIEQYVPNARHVEVQIIGDKYNNIIHLYDRECSIQRNHQKIIEEAPAIFLTKELRLKILDAALRISKAVNYSGAGTVEFLIDESGNYFFMEMNPRIQVEHAVTEEITGIDIVSEQLKIASGFPLSVTQEMVSERGHSIELRVYTEDPSHNFAPSPLPVRSVNLPEHANLRIESDIQDNAVHTTLFDPLVLKVIAMGENRESVINLLIDKIKNLNILGPETNTRYLEAILLHPDYKQNKLSVEFCSKNHKALISKYIKPSTPADIHFLIALCIDRVYLKNDRKGVSDLWNHLGYWRLTETYITLTIDEKQFHIGLNLRNKADPEFIFEGQTFRFKTVNESKNKLSIQIGRFTKELSYLTDNLNNVHICCNNYQYMISFPGLLSNSTETVIRSDIGLDLETLEIKSPLHGKVLEINVEKNQNIKKGDLMMVIEAMKSENRILSPKDAKVKKIAVKVGAQVTDQMPLLFLEDKL